MITAWMRRLLSVAVVLASVFVAGCEAAENADNQAQIRDDNQAGDWEQAYGEWARSRGPDNIPGFPCGPPGDGLPTNEPAPHFVDWSPDGTQLIFDDSASVHLVNVDGARLREIVDANPGYGFPDGMRLYAEFSPDGQEIVYASCEYPTEGLKLRSGAPWTPRGEYQFEIATVTLDGSRARRLTTDGRYDHLPAWSPEGRRIAYMSDRNPAEPSYAALWVLSLQGDDLAPDIDLVLPNEGRTAFAPRWSPDGERFAVLSAERPDRIREGVFVRVSGLVVVVADGSTQHAVTGGVISGVSWSPNGMRLALVRRQGPDAQLVTIAANGSDERVIREIEDLRGLAKTTHKPHQDYPLSQVEWSPDGAHILYGCGYQLCVVNLDGEIVGRSPEEFANERGRAAAAWAPDGSRVAVRAAGNPTPNGAVALYTMAPDGSDVRVLVRGGLAMVAEHSGYQDAAAGKAACREGDVVPNPASNPGLVADCETLMAMRDTLAGPTILNWGAGTPLAQWAGVQVSGEPPRVTGLKFRSRQGVHSHESLRLIGHIPPETSDLDQLQTLDLSGHTFFDDVPRDLERLAHLRELDLRLHGGAWMSGCLSAAFIEQLEVAEGVRVCAQASGA